MKAEPNNVSDAVAGRLAKLEPWAIGLTLLVALPQLVLVASVHLSLLVKAPLLLDSLGAARAWMLYWYSVFGSWGLCLGWVAVRLSLLRGRGCSWRRFFLWTLVPLGLGAVLALTLLLLAYWH
jgi:hypothetical protein